MQSLHISPGELPPACEELRAEVREFIAKNLSDYPAARRAQNWTGRDREFSRKLGEGGGIGMTWPMRFGGGERCPLLRYVVLV